MLFANPVVDLVPTTHSKFAIMYHIVSKPFPFRGASIVYKTMCFHMKYFSQKVSLSIKPVTTY